MAAAGLLDPGRRERVETSAPGVLVNVVLRSGSARSPRRREAGWSTVCHRHLPRRTAEVGGPSGPETDVACSGSPPREVSSGTEGRVVCRLRPISCGRRGTHPEVLGLASLGTLLQTAELSADFGLWGSMPGGAGTSERSRLFSGPRFGARVRPRRDASEAGWSGQRRRDGDIAIAPGFVLLLISSAFSRGLSTVEIDGRCSFERCGRGRPGVRLEVNAFVARGHARVS